MNTEENINTENNEKIEENKVENPETKNINEQKTEEESNSILRSRNYCQMCGNSNEKPDKNKNILYFNVCRHGVCYNCLYKIIIRSYIYQLSFIHNTNNKIKIDCICSGGQMELSIYEIINIFIKIKNSQKQINQNTNNNNIINTNNLEPNKTYCELHKDTEISDYCLDCLEPVCSKCTNYPVNKLFFTYYNQHNLRQKPLHYNHKTVSYKEFFSKIYGNLLELPNLTIILENHKKLIDGSYEKYCDLINCKFESLLSEINYYKENLLIKIKEKYEKFKQSMLAINLLYDCYNNDLLSINQSSDINQLMFLYNTNIVLPEIDFQYTKMENILNNIMKKFNDSQIEELIKYKFNKNFSKNYKCIQTINTAHENDINCLCLLNDKKIVSGDYKGYVKIWKISNNGYILNQNLNQIFNGPIDKITNINLNKFTACSPVANYINIYQEDINNEQFVSIQKISFENDKLISTVNTLNDKNTLIISTNDNFVHIYQDKIGGIPMQNYMKTKYELVDSFETFHTNKINYILHTSNEKLITASDDSTLKIWNKDRTYETLLGHSDSVNIVIELDNNYLCSASSDNHIIIWENDKKYKLKQKIQAHNYSIRGLVYLNNGKIISVSIDETIKIWERNRYDLYINKITYKEHKGGITDIVLIDNDIFITCSWDKSIKIWFAINEDSDDEKNEKGIVVNKHNDTKNDYNVKITNKKKHRKGNDKEKRKKLIYNVIEELINEENEDNLERSASKSKVEKLIFEEENNDCGVEHKEEEDE